MELGSLGPRCCADPGSTIDGDRECASAGVTGGEAATLALLLPSCPVAATDAGAGNTLNLAPPRLSQCWPLRMYMRIFMLFTMPPPFTASALVAGTFGPSFPGIKPTWLGAGVLEPDPVPVRVPLLDEYNDGPVVLVFLRTTDDRLMLNAGFALKRLSAENALTIVPELSTDMSMLAGVGADEAR